SAGGVAGGKFDVGAYERDLLVLAEGDNHGRNPRSELFAVDHLDDAIVRLYERYPEHLPDGPGRTRAVATARTVAALVVTRPEGAPLSGIFDPDIEWTDSRTVGTESLRGRKELLAAIGAMRDLVDDFLWRTDDLLALRSDALLICRTNFGTMRDGGGAYERPLCHLLVFGADGLVTR